MKKTLYILAISLLTFASCTDLNVDVVSQYTSYPENEIAVEGMMSDVYFHMKGALGRRYMEAQCLSSDEFTCLAFDGGYYDNGTYAHQALHCSFPDDASLDYCSAITAGITKANKVILTLGGNEAPAAASARAIRAFFTWMFMDNFGDTPILDRIPEDGEIIPRSARKDVAEWIESELLDVIPLLTTEVNANTYGKPTKWMAEALLVKLYINWPVYTAASVDAYDASTATNAKLADCIKYCDDIINSGKFNLGSMEYRFKFAPTNGPAVEDFIYAMPYDAVSDNNAGSGFQYARPRSYKNLKGMVPNYYGSADAFTQSFGGNMVLTPEMADLFCLEGDQRNNCVLGGPVFNYDATTLLPTDKPFEYKGVQVVFTKDITLIKTDNTVDVGNTGESAQQGYHSIKWFIVPEDYNNGRCQSNDLPIFRFADILLTKAEALVRSSKSGAKDLFNQVRAYAKAPLLDHEPSLQELLDERGREFFDENWRRNDMIRFGTYESEFFPHYTDFPDANFDKKHRIFPVHIDAMNANPGWVQNPGY